MAHLDRVAVWQRSDGGVSITYFDERDRFDGESDEDFIERISLKHGQSPSLQGATRSVIAKSNIPADKKDRNKWRFKNGKVTVDPTIELPEEARARIKVSAKAKLKSGQPLTDEEADAIVG